MTGLTHYTLLADGEVVEPNEEFGTEAGPAIMAMKVWAKDPDQAVDMIVDIGQQLGFRPSGELQVFVTEPEEPEEDEPFGYDVQFTAYSGDDEIDDAGDDDEDERPEWLN